MRISPFLRDLLLTAATSLVTVVCSLLLTRLLAVGLGPSEFGAYTIARRVVATILPISTLSAGVALTRYLGLEKGRKGSAAGYLTSAFGLTLAATGVSVVALVAVSGAFSNWCFGDSQHQTLVAAVAFMVAGSGFYEIAYANYRGRLEMVKANLWQLAIMAAGPLVIGFVWARGAAASRMVFLIGILAYPVLLTLIPKCIRDWSAARREGNLGQSLRLVWRYGVPRVPGALALAGLLTLGPSLAAHLYSLGDAGFLAVGQSLLRIVEAAVVAFGVVALPRLALQFGSGEEGAIRESVSDIAALLFQVGLFATLHLWLWADLLVPLWLGAQYSAAIPVTRIVVLSLAPYLAYSMLQSVVNALEVRAVNTRIGFTSLGVAAVLSLALSYAGLGITGIAAGSTIGFALLGVLTLAYLRHRLHFSWSKLLPARTTLANAGLFLLAWTAHRWLVPTHGGLISLVKLGAVEVLLFLVYLVLLWHWKVGWMEQVRKRLRFGEPAA